METTVSKKQMEIKKCGDTLNALEEPPFSADTHEFGTANELTHTERKRKHVRMKPLGRVGYLNKQLLGGTPISLCNYESMQLYKNR